MKGSTARSVYHRAFRPAGSGSPASHMVRFVLGVCVVELALRLSSYARRSGRLLRWTVIPMGGLLPLFGIGALLPEWLLERIFRRDVAPPATRALEFIQMRRRLRETTRQFTIVMG